VTVVPPVYEFVTSEERHGGAVDGDAARAVHVAA